MAFARGPKKRLRNICQTTAACRARAAIFCDVSSTSRWTYRTATVLAASQRPFAIRRNADDRHPSVHRPFAVRACHRWASVGGTGRRKGAHRAGKAARPRPGVVPRDQRRRRRGLPGGADLPHRPLSRQGDGPEHLALRFGNSVVRAGVEREGIDHVQITVAETVGLEGARAFTTTPARCATWCRTTCCNCSR